MRILIIVGLIILLLIIIGESWRRAYPAECVLILPIFFASSPDCCQDKVRHRTRYNSVFLPFSASH